MDGWMNEWMDELINEWMDEWMSEWMNEGSIDLSKQYGPPTVLQENKSYLTNDGFVASSTCSLSNGSYALFGHCCL